VKLVRRGWESADKVSISRSSEAARLSIMEAKGVRHVSVKPCLLLTYCQVSNAYSTAADNLEWLNTYKRAYCLNILSRQLDTRASLQ